MKTTYHKKKDRICRRVSIFFIMTCVLVGIFPLRANAGDAAIKSTLVKDGSIYIYIQGASEISPEDVSVQIGNSACEPEQLSLITPEEMETSMRTVILLDNSQSISESYHASIREILSGYIYGSPENEEIRIGTMSDTVSYLCEYTNNREELAQIVEGLSYQNQSTYLNDILYEVITGLNTENTGIYTKLIVIADGADEQTIGYTSAEVNRLIEKSPYPVYAVGTKEKNNTAGLETLFSYSRTAASEYFLLDGNTAGSAVIAGLSADRDYICIRIAPDEALMDGSNKNILIKLSTEDGEIQLTASADMPFGDGNVHGAEETEDAEASGSGEEQPETLTEEESAGNEETPPQEQQEQEEPQEQKEGNRMPIIWIAVIVLAAAAAGAVIFICGRRKKKGKMEAAQPQPERTEIMREQDTERTMIMSDDDSTEIMGMGDDDASAFITEKYICLQCTEQRERTYRVPIRDVVRIGRTEGDIRIGDDRKVSRLHCEIALRGNMLYIKDVGSSNGTYYQDRQIYEETYLGQGDEIKIGSFHYIVELTEG